MTKWLVLFVLGIGATGCSDDDECNSGQGGDDDDAAAGEGEASEGEGEGAEGEDGAEGEGGEGEPAGCEVDGCDPTVGLECVNGECDCGGSGSCAGTDDNICCSVPDTELAGCVNLMGDTGNCGECNHACADGEGCADGQCVPAGP
jgi:hypothetical protein